MVNNVLTKDCYNTTHSILFLHLSYHCQINSVTYVIPAKELHNCGPPVLLLSAENQEIYRTSCKSCDKRGGLKEEISNVEARRERGALENPRGRKLEPVCRVRTGSRHDVD